MGIQFQGHSANSAVAYLQGHSANSAVAYL